MMFGMLRYERATGPGPTQNDSSALRTCNDVRSAFGKNRDGLHAEFVGRTVHAHRDLAAVGDQQLLEHGYASIAKSGWP
jgi:hypothetical protein